MGSLDLALPRLESVWATSLPELSRPVAPLTAPHPRLLALNDDLARELRIDPRSLRSAEGLHFLTGSVRAPGSTLVAQVYAGHQWGQFRALLGDGRAALLGERRDASGALRDIHAKGIGPTSMSRVDGFATVGPMLREFVIGEAMHTLGLSTTRALAVTATGAPRSLDGVTLPGGVLVRSARSHIRYGSFEYVERSTTHHIGSTSQLVTRPQLHLPGSAEGSRDTRGPSCSWPQRRRPSPRLRIRTRTRTMGRRTRPTLVDERVLLFFGSQLTSFVRR